MTWSKATGLALWLALLAGLLGGCERPAPPPAKVTAANSYLETIAVELLGPGEPVDGLAGPGMCPGHFDIRPSQIQRMRGCRVLLRFDFQRSLDDKLSPLADGGLRIVPVRPCGGLCVPDTYLAACREVAAALVAAGLLDQADASARLVGIETRLLDLSRRVRARLAEAGLSGRPVVASAHQEAFCLWLGLSVAGTFSGSDQAGTSELVQAFGAGQAAGAAVVVANRPEGRKAADALAERLAARVTVFDNFPSASGGAGSFDAMVEANVQALMAGEAK